MKRIVITGLGAITPIGNDAESFWANLLAGKSGASRLTLFDPNGMPYGYGLRSQGL
jgi:3-oxoacyl-[acyl-carrier-protein] synthase II